MTLWLRATKRFSDRPTLMPAPARGRALLLVAQSHKEWLS